MPLGIQRLNVKKSQPNAHINFIKALKGSDEIAAQGFLETIAAQCLPVMRENHLYVMALEEYEPNREFVGRNFNAGEVIQLVLKSPRTGRWLPFEYVQMVMMHELAHCKQMNHSKAFWGVRNQYATQMYGLWAKGYRGDGIWGRGANLETGEWEKNTVLPSEVLPEHLCGGTYRSRKKKGKAKPTLSYQEKKERRILKKFGKNGTALGADDEVKVKLEKGKKIQAKPRQAGSARGRDLRAAAALARFDQQKDDKPSVKDEDETESGTDSDYDDEDSADLGSLKDAVDVDGSRLTDKKGRGMVKVCEDEDASDPGARNELDELQDMFRGKKRSRVKEESPEVQVLDAPRNGTVSSGKRKDTSPAAGSVRDKRVKKEDTPGSATPITISRAPPAVRTTSKPASKPPPQRTAGEARNTATCSVCSFANTPGAVTCIMCANVLNPETSPSAWRCRSSSCADGVYWNSGDCGLCGVCGVRKAH